MGQDQVTQKVVTTWAVASASGAYAQAEAFFSDPKALTSQQVKSFGLEKALNNPGTPRVTDKLGRQLIFVKDQVFAKQPGQDGAFGPGWYQVGPATATGRIFSAANEFFERASWHHKPPAPLSTAEEKRLHLDRALYDNHVPKFDDSPSLPGGVKRTALVLNGNVYVRQDGTDGDIKEGWYKVGREHTRRVIDELISSTSSAFFQRAPLDASETGPLKAELAKPNAEKVQLSVVGGAQRTLISVKGVSYVNQTNDAGSFQAGWYRIGPTPFAVPTG
jgi:hypothetical protein